MQNTNDNNMEQDNKGRDAQRVRDWESATFGGLMLGLGDARGGFESVERHRPLNVKPREIDVLIRRKPGLPPAANPVARLFRAHNIVELKNPAEALDIDTLCNVASYGLQYKASGEAVDAVPLAEVTLTIVRVSRPDGLLRYLPAHGLGVEAAFLGIYYVTGLTALPTQVVVGSELAGDAFAALRVLRRNARKEDLRAFLLSAAGLGTQGERKLADAVLRVSLTENRETYNELWKEEADMDKEFREALEYVMGDRINELMSDRIDKQARWLAAEMLRDDEPVSKIEKYTKLAGDAIAEIARGIGVEPVMG